MKHSILTRVKKSARLALAKRGNAGLQGILLYHRIRRLVVSRTSDETFAQRMHLRSTGKSLDLVNPTTFDEKQWWLKLHHRDPLMVECSDKVAVRDYVTRLGYADSLNEVFGVWENADDIDWNSLPRSVYFKTNNSSDSNIRVDDTTTADRKSINGRLDLLLKKDHYALSREWNYAQISPRIFAERVLDASGSDDGLVDYRFLCSFGTCHGIFVDLDTADSTGSHRPDARRNVYDRDFNLLPVRVSRPRITDRELSPPSTLTEMIRMAERLSQPFPFCRVDLFEIEGRIIFGEMTFFHAGGCSTLEPDTFETLMGEWIDLSPLPIKPSGELRA